MLVAVTTGLPWYVPLMPSVDVLLSCAHVLICRSGRQVVESRAREQTADEHDSGAVWVSALTLVDLAGRCGSFCNAHAQSKPMEGMRETAIVLTCLQ